MNIILLPKLFRGIVGRSVGIMPLLGLCHQEWIGGVQTGIEAVEMSALLRSHPDAPFHFTSRRGENIRKMKEFDLLRKPNLIYKIDPNVSSCVIFFHRNLSVQYCLYGLHQILFSF